MTEQTAQAPPLFQARVGGFFYLVIIVAAFVAEVLVRGSLIVSNDAAATAHNILGSELLYRAGAGIDLVVLFCDTVVALVLYVVLRPAGAGLALLAAFFRLVFVAIMAANTILFFVPLLLLKGGNDLSVFSAEQAQALSLVALKLHNMGYNVALVFFGVHCILIGGLIAKSELLPRILGLLVAIAGGCYLVNSFNNFLPHELHVPLLPYILLPGLVAESLLALWLFFVGINVRRWHELAKG